MITRLLIFGSGDLTFRYLFPALSELRAEGHLPDGFEIVGVGREEWTTEDYRGRAAEGVDDDELLAAVEYRVGDATDPEALAPLLAGGGAVVAYLALPPAVFEGALEALRAAGLPDGSRVVVEKPFGEDLESAQRLNRLLASFLPEDAVFRVDHFLGLQTVQNVLGLRFANRLFEPVWNAANIESVAIVWDETLALEGRAGYYDGTGALKDMIQNHLLQVLCLVAMEPPHSLGAQDLRDRKVEVLRAVRRLSPEEVERSTVRARYAAGEVDGRRVPAYAEEEGVDPDLGTETFAQVELSIDNWRWAGVPFVLRSGKGLPADRHEVVVTFKPVPHLAFGQEQQPPRNVLRLQMEPDRVAIEMEVNGPGDPFDLEHVELEHAFPEPPLGAYAQLLLDVLEGDPRLSIRGDEAEEAWRIVAPILQHWQRGGVALEEYPAGTSP